jgi:nitrogen regulatory protein PII
MKKVTAFILPFKLEDVKEKLVRVGIRGMTYSEIMGSGHYRGTLAQVYRGGDLDNGDLAPWLLVEIVVADEILPYVIEAIISSARANRCNGGKIFVETVDKVIRIRTGEEGPVAI